MLDFGRNLATADRAAEITNLPIVTGKPFVVLGNCGFIFRHILVTMLDVTAIVKPKDANEAKCSILKSDGDEVNILAPKLSPEIDSGKHRNWVIHAPLGSL
jgi:hypothetical protein